MNHHNDANTPDDDSYKPWSYRLGEIRQALVTLLATISGLVVTLANGDWGVESTQMAILGVAVFVGVFIVENRGSDQRWKSIAALVVTAATWVGGALVAGGDFAFGLETLMAGLAATILSFLFPNEGTY